MSNEKFLPYLLRFTVANLLAFVIYYLSIILLNLITGGGVAVMSGVQTINGWTENDLSPFLRVLIPLFLSFVYVLMFFMFYLFMYIRLLKSKERHDTFLRYIGTKPFDRHEFSKYYIKNGPGKKEFLYFSLIVTISTVLTNFLPFGLLIGMVGISQQAIGSFIVMYLPLTGFVRSLISTVLSVGVSILIYRMFLNRIVPRIFESWALKRLHVD